MARSPFSEETIDRFLPLLDDTVFVKELGEELKNAFKVRSSLGSVKFRRPIQKPMKKASFQHDKGFDKKMFENQLSVMRGQIFNLREALRTKKSPYQLVLMPAQYMVEVSYFPTLTV